MENRCEPKNGNWADRVRRGNRNYVVRLPLSISPNPKTSFHVGKTTEKRLVFNQEQNSLAVVLHIVLRCNIRLQNSDFLAFAMSNIEFNPSRVILNRKLF